MKILMYVDYEMTRNKASGIMSIFKEKARKLEEVDKFNLHMASIKH